MGDVVATLVGGLIAGIIIGPLARLVLPGKQNISIGMTILIGAVGAILGGFLADAIGVGDTDGIEWSSSTDRCRGARRVVPPPEIQVRGIRPLRAPDP
jgi:uncharacterized membrane protein YeaQ/YmgE (transglycosylase-associated protein family)